MRGFVQNSLLLILLLGCASTPSPTHMTLEEAKRIDKIAKSDWKKEYIYVCDTYGGKRFCQYAKRRDVERRIRMMTGGI